MKKYTKKQVKDFLIESNAIEQVYDVVSLEQATHAWEYLCKVDKMTSGHILKLHKILMLHQNLAPDEKGYFRRVPVWVGRREGMNFMLIPAAVDQWVLNSNDLIQNGNKEPALWKEKMTQTHHIVYEKIHPFVDGNGRTGRILMNWERMHLGLPILIINADWPKENGEQVDYYSWFKDDRI